MKNKRILCLFAVLMLAACSEPPHAPPPNYVIPPGPPPMASHLDSNTPSEDSDLRRIDATKLPVSHATLAPAGAGEYGRGPAGVYTPPGAKASPGYVAPNPSPVTGYGPGGMGRPPGSPANPPYTP